MSGTEDDLKQSLISNADDPNVNLLDVRDRVHRFDDL